MNAEKEIPCRIGGAQIHGFATGDMVIADVPSGKKSGIYKGCIAICKSGSFNIQTINGVIQGISWKFRITTKMESGEGARYGRKKILAQSGCD